MMEKYVSSQSIQGLYKNPCTTNCFLYLMISLFSLCFRTNTHLYPTSFTSSGVQTTGPKTSQFVNKSNSACIASFHFGQSFICWHSSTFRGLGSSSFLMISKATWKMKILLITILFRSHFLPCVHNLPRSHNFQVLVPLQGFLIQFVPLQGLFVQYVPFSGAFCIIYAYYGAIDLSILN